MITQHALQSLLDYDPKTGHLIWRINASGNAQAGSVAGSINEHGYRYIKVGGKLQAAHRLVWFYHHGEWPKYDIGHINGTKLDNRIENLTDLPRGINQARLAAATSTNPLGRGVQFLKKTGKFIARIIVHGWPRQIGTFETPEAAHRAYQRAHVEAYGIESPYFEIHHKPHPGLKRLAANALFRMHKNGKL